VAEYLCDIECAGERDRDAIRIAVPTQLFRTELYALD